MAEVRFTKEHEWIRVDGTSATVGITDYAQSQLGDIVFVEVPTKGKQLKSGGEAAVVESVKAASEVYSPVSGTVTEGNVDLPNAPETVNQDAEGKGWFFKLTISNPAELSALMDRAAYDKYVAELKA
jgi:glycine cleavage system H protein